MCDMETLPHQELQRNINDLYTEVGAQGEIRTLTPVKAGDFESPASTIPPLGHLVGD